MNRLLTCNSCDHIWTGPSEVPDGPMHCPRCGAHVCACGCGANLDDQRSDTRWKARSCYMSLQRSAGATTPSAKANVARTRGRVGGRGGNVADLDQARDLQAASAEKDRWTRIVREQIARTLIATEAFHADDCDALGVPVEHCNLIGLETAAFRNRGLMESTGVYRKVSHRAAKGRKAPIYRITAKGRQELTVGVDASRGPVEGIAAESTTVAGIHPGDRSVGHRAGGRGEQLGERFWRKVDRSGPCWVWTSQTTPNGYGRYSVEGKKVVAHRVSYEAMVGPVPDGLQLDHLCRNRACVNPDHLEPVTAHENHRRGGGHGKETECPSGHPYAGDNLYIAPDGRRYCKTCRRENKRRYRADARADATPSSVSGGQSAQVNTGAPTSKEAGRATNPPVPSASEETGGSPESVTGPSGEPARSFEAFPLLQEALSLLPEPDPESWAA